MPFDRLEPFCLTVIANQYMEAKYAAVLLTKFSVLPHTILHN
jgi:hypothetical protein